MPYSLSAAHGMADKRIDKITFRVTAAERERIENIASHCGLSLTELLLRGATVYAGAVAMGEQRADRLA